MSSSAPPISIVIPHYNDLVSLGRCLDAIDAQTVPRERYEVIVADNASPVGLDAVEALVAGRARVVLVTERGAGAARNGGVAVAAGEILAFTDCDCLPEPGWLDAGVRALDRYGLVGGRMTVLVDDPNHMTPAEAFEMVFAFDNRDYVLRKHFTVTANLFVRKADFDRVGPYRGAVSEDVDWCLRARACGLQIGYVEEAAVGHPARRTWPELERKWLRITSEEHALTMERPRGALRWAIKAAMLPPSALAHLPKVLTSPKLNNRRDRLAAAAVLVRSRLLRSRESFRLLLARSGV